MTGEARHALRGRGVCFDIKCGLLQDQNAPPAPWTSRIKIPGGRKAGRTSAAFCLFFFFFLLHLSPSCFPFISEHYAAVWRSASSRRSSSEGMRISWNPRVQRWCEFIPRFKRLNRWLYAWATERSVWTGVWVNTWINSSEECCVNAPIICPQGRSGTNTLHLHTRI